MITPLPYRPIESQMVAEWYIRKTYDGWDACEVRSWTRESGDYDRVQEFTKLAQSFIRQFGEYKEFQKYFGKYGKVVTKDEYDGEPTLAFVVEEPLLDYVFSAQGPHLTITAYRKTNKEE